MASPALRSRKSAALALRAQQQYNDGPREEGLSPLSGGGFSRSLSVIIRYTLPLCLAPLGRRLQQVFVCRKWEQIR